MSFYSTLKESIEALIPRQIRPVPSLGFKYPANRDHPLHSCDQWLQDKANDDGAEGLWRIHDELYDLNDFIHKHPGGPSWLDLTKGTDITEAFEAHHISSVPEQLLPKYFVRKANAPRNSPFIFEDNGFYRTMKRNVREAMKDLPSWPRTRSKFYTDGLFLSYVLSALFAAYFWSFLLGTFSGFLLTFAAIASHNFFHQRDNFRMYYFDFTLMRSRSWRISHAMSHHIYPNTIIDLEISFFEPWFQYLPQEKHPIVRYFSWVYSPIVCVSVFFVYWLSETIQCFVSWKGFSLAQLLPFTIPMLMSSVAGYPVYWAWLMFLWILVVGSFVFGVIGVTAGHHHPQIFHDGDAPRLKKDMDWGIYQMDAVINRKEITGSPILVLINFGDHALHHLFPTIDHGLLEYLYPVFRKTCEEFGIEIRVKSQLQMVYGQFRQLAKVEPSLQPRRFVKKEVND